MTAATIGTWAAEGVTVEEVDQALMGLRRRDRRGAVRASVLTLVIVVRDRPAADAALDVVTDLGTRFPSRAVVLIVGHGSQDGHPALSASAAVRAAEQEGADVCFEEIVLEVRGRARHHLDSVVTPFALPDVPLVVWLPATLPAAGDPLLATADRIVVDSRAVAEEGSADRRQVLPRIAALSRRLPVADLSWSRLGPWRSLMAGLFDNPDHRPFLDGIQSVEVAGNFGPRHLLGGWLQRRLGVPLSMVHLSPAEHVSMRVTARHLGVRGVFAVERNGPARVVDAWARLDDGPCTEQTLTMRRQWPALSLANALTRMGGDQVYRDALAGALDLVGRDAA